MFIKGVVDGEYPVEFTHCGHEVNVQKEAEKAKK